LKNNLGFTAEIVTGIKLAPYQEITLRGLMNRNYSLCVWGRGCGKTFIASVFCMLQAMLEPDSRIIIAGPTFRTSRFIFNKIEEILSGRKAVLARQAFETKPSKRNDIHEFKLSNGSAIAAIPLSGEKIRGFRANILVIDEYLLMSREIIDTVLKPFLTAPQDISERQEILEMEDSLIDQGVMKESERRIFEDKTKLIGLSSASYTFENLFVTYADFIKKIYNPKYYENEEGDSGASYEEGEIPPKYFVSQLAWDAIPKHMINKSVIKEAESGGINNAIFQREYCAQFSDGSEGFFSAKKMMEVTIPDGQSPTLMLKGDPNREYIMAIDPSFSNSPTSDDFGMSVLEIDKETKTSVLVHVYGQHGKDLKEHIKYFHHLMINFNIVYIAIDNAGYQFLDSYNESHYARESKINIKFIEYDSSKDEDEERRKAKREYNLKIHRIANRIVFSNNNWIRQANEHLQGEIDYKKIWFASHPGGSESLLPSMMRQEVNMELIKALEDKTVKDDIITKSKFIDEVGFKIKLTKKQCAMIEVRANPRGTQTFDFPLHISREQGVGRARRDNYTSLLIATWAVKCYFDFTELPNEQFETFVPFFAK
jgi:hypothetical protein|tara:strand:- start:14767 stop:16557 length:1791 start_codon:yes stop_codon:yes gene_type:complete